MPLRTLLGEFVAAVLYPLWLLAGAIDYFCHRKTSIERTSGATESRLHLAEFLCVGALLVTAVLLEITLSTLILMFLAVLTHTALSFKDVSYTLGRRPISTLEQHVHGVLNVLPFVAVGLLGILHWDGLQFGAPLRLKDEPLSFVHQALLLGSFLLLAGTPTLEEWFRTERAAGAAPPASK